MAALCTGNYGMSQNCTDDSKEYFFVKLTDSAYRAVEEYQRNQSKYSTHATIQIIENGGIISFPTNSGNVGQQFSFSIDIEGSFECIRQTQNQLDVLGALAYKMRIHANDDVYETTRYRMAVAEENQKNKCTREIKPNQTDIGRKVKLKSTGNRLPNIPPKRDLQQNPTTSQSPLSSSLHNNSSPSSNSLLLNGGSLNSSLSPKNNNGILCSSSLSSSSATSSLSLSSSNNISNNNHSSNNNINNSNNNYNSNNNNNNGLSTIGAASSLPSSSSPSLGSLKSSSNINNMSTTSSSVAANSLNNNNNNSSMNYNSNNNINSSNSSNNISTKLQHQSSYSNSIAGLTTGLSTASSLSSVLSSAAGSGTSGINSGYFSNNGRLGNSNSSLNGAGSRRGTTGVSGSASRNQKAGNRHMPDITKKKIRERLIHLLALKPFKKPELYARLQNEGIREREKGLISGILKEISTMKDNTYNLKRQIWNDVNEDWPFYTEQELQMLKRRKPQNLTPPLSSDGGSSTSGQSPTSTHNGSPPPAVKRPSLDRDRYYEEPIAKKQRISHFRKDTNDITSRRNGITNSKDSKMNTNPRSRDPISSEKRSSYYGSSLPSKRHHDAEESHIGLTYSVLGNDAARHISPRDDCLNGHFTSSHNYTSSNNNNNNNNSNNNNNNNKNSLSSSNSNNLRQQSPSNYYNNTSNSNKTNFISESRRQTLSPVIVGNNNSSNQSPSITGDRRRNYNSNNNILPPAIDIVGNSDGGKHENPGHLSSNSGITDSSSAYKNNNNESSGNNNSNSNSKATNQTTGGPLTHKSYDFSKFTKITSIEQRRLYKTEFEKDYDEYRELLNKIESVGKRFKLLAQKLDNARNNESNYRVIKKQILAEYDKINREQEHQRTKARFDYLHAKLAHIKALVNEFDQTLISSSSTSSSTTNPSSQGNPSDPSSGSYGRNNRMASSNSPLQNFNPSNGNASSSANYRNLSPNNNSNNGNLGSQQGSPNLLQHHLPKLENY